MAESIYQDKLVWLLTEFPVVAEVYQGLPKKFWSKQKIIIIKGSRTGDGVWSHETRNAHLG